jgi:hypothetical protein
VNESPSIKQRCQARLKGLYEPRLPWWGHWRELANYILPRRYRWLLSPNEAQNYRASMMNSTILDSTGTLAARVLAAGMMAGITSPSRPWFKLTMESADNDQSSDVNRWLAECQRRMARVFNESNFYNSMATMYLDLGVFGTGPVIIYEDREDVIRCYNPCAGEYYITEDDAHRIGAFAREFVMTVEQVVQKWGKENCSEQTQVLYDRADKSSLTTEIAIGHLIERNDDPEYGISDRFAYREIYWEITSSDTEKPLAVTGFYEWPVPCPRWDVTGNDAYGYSPAMDALGDIKQLQQETKRKAQAIDKMVNPPLLADVQLKNQPASTLPGGVTYIAGLNQSAHAGMRPIYQVMPPVQELMTDIKEVQDRIKRIFHNDLFMMFQELQAEPRSAAAVDARREEKLINLGPVLERVYDEALDKIVDRVFGIMWRAGLFPSPPPEIQGKTIKVEYVSMLAEAQKAVATGGIERLLAQLGNLAAVKPDIMDVFNETEGMQTYGMLLSVDPKLIRNDNEIAAIRQARAKQAAEDRAAQMSMAAVQGAKTLSETDVGGGQNALQRMLQ